MTSGLNTTSESGVAALLGGPTDSLEDVISATQGDTVAGKMIAAIERERANPTGQPAIEPLPAAPLCGLFGFEGLLGLAGLTSLKLARPARRRRARG